MVRRGLDRLSRPAAVLLVAALYFALARFGLRLAIPQTNATPVWPPSGFALAAVLLLGDRAWPGIALGAFAANLAGFLGQGIGSTAAATAVSAAIAGGNALEALAGAWLLRRLGAAESPFGTFRSAVCFIATALAACAVSAAVGPASQLLAGFPAGAAWAKVSFTWWLGDLAGVLAFTPFFWSLAVSSPRWPAPRRAAEAALLAAVFAAASAYIFAFPPSSPHPLPSFLLPLFLWAVFRFGLLGAAAAVAGTSLLSAWGAASGGGPFQGAELNSALIMLQLYVAIIAASILLMHAVVQERRSAQDEARALNRLLERKVRQRTALLAAANSELESFDYSVAHDLRAPLRSIESFSRLLEDEQASRLDARGRDFLARVRGACGRMGDLIDGLLQVSVASSAPLKAEDVDLAALAREIFERRSEAEPERRVQWKAPERLVVRGDAALLSTVLENLIDNAYKFTKGRDPAMIEFGVKKDPDGDVYFVRDNGVGFEQSQVSRLFGIFERLHDPALFPGTGVGLAQVQRLVRRHGGRAWALGSADSGAVFSFTLSAEPAETSS